MKLQTKKLVLTLVAVISSFALLADEAYAAKKKDLEKVKSSKTVSGASVKSKPKGGVPMSTEHIFDGAMVNGRYQMAGEAVSIVEADKQMNDLISGRRNFKDRLAVERARLKKSAASGQ